jgi:Acetyltransferases, including N-acetylases of ribosomal proteins
MALSVDSDQNTFVASNLLSVAQSKVYEYLIPAVICLKGDPIGFLLYGQDPESERVYIVRLMIDRQFQRKGYGKIATRLLIERLKDEFHTDEIFLSIVPANHLAARMYQALGFIPTAERDEDGEIIFRLDTSEAEQGAAANP